MKTTKGGGSMTTIATFEINTVEDLNQLMDCDIANYSHAEHLANRATEITGEKYLPVSRESTLPKCSIVRAPKVGDVVSRQYNGDANYVGVVVSISSTFKKVTVETDEGYYVSFYRVKNTGAWRESKSPFYMVKGVVNARNPHL